MSNSDREKRQENPYQKIFDDAKRKLEESDQMKTLERLDDDSDKCRESIPFPYGGYGNSAYNFK